jgi:hypothetical protein
MDAIRSLNESYPQQFTPQVLHKHFGVSFEAIRRILKSKWRPSTTEAEDRRKRWEKRGKQIWEKLADEGVKPPKKWQEMGIGGPKKGEDGVPRWKKGEWQRRKGWWEREVVEGALGAKMEKGESAS